MSEHNAEIGLDAIIAGVNSAELVGEILDLYAGSLAGGRKFSSQVILPCLDARIAAVIKGCHETVARVQMDRAAMRRVVQAASDLAREVSGLRAVYNAVDLDGPMTALVRELAESTLEVYKGALPILRTILDEETAVLKLNTSFFEEIHGRSKVLAGDGEFEGLLAAGAIRDVAIQLVAFRDVTTAGQVRLAIDRFLRSVVAGGEKADHLVGVMGKRLAKNELMSSEVVTSAGMVSERYAGLVALLVELVKTVYVSEETRRELTGAIEAYRCVYSRWEVDGKRVHDGLLDEGIRGA